MAILLTIVAALAVSMGVASSDTYVPISGAGSTWSENAIDQWRRDVSPLPLRVNYGGTGSEVALFPRRWRSP
jgi:phosphate transport system substrate-binding protein